MNLADELQANTEEFIESFADVPDRLFNALPEKKQWSVGQIVEHINRAEYGIPRLFNGPSKPANREPAEKVPLMTEKLSDQTAKYSAFGPILPSEELKNKTELSKKFSDNRKKIINLIDKQNIEEICMLFEHPFFGELTRLEWIRFCIIHAERHRQQILSTLKKITF